MMLHTGMGVTGQSHPSYTIPFATQTPYLMLDQDELQFIIDITIDSKILEIFK